MLCPECGQLFVAPAFAVLQVIVDAWMGEETEDIDPRVKRLMAHEHPWEEFIEVKGGRPLTDAGAPPVGYD